MPPNGGPASPTPSSTVLKLWIEQGGRENAGSKAAMPAKPKVDIGLKSVAEGQARRPAADAAAGQAQDSTRSSAAAGRTRCWRWPPARGRRSSPSAGRSRCCSTTPTPATSLGVLPFEHGQINSLKFSRNAQARCSPPAAAAGSPARRSSTTSRPARRSPRSATRRRTRSSPPTSSADQTHDRRRRPDASWSASTPPPTARVVREIKKHTDWVTAVEFSPDGVLLATGDRNGGLFVWEAATGREFLTLRGHTATITDVSWRADSNVLASASEDGTVRLWEMENGDDDQELGGPRRRGAGGAVRPRRPARQHRPRPGDEAVGRQRRPCRSSSRRSPTWG